jgi:hypothetical protein
MELDKVVIDGCLLRVWLVLSFNLESYLSNFFHSHHSTTISGMGSVIHQSCTMVNFR